MSWEILLHLRSSDRRRRTETARTRRERLRTLEKVIRRRQDDMVAAAHADFGKPAAETLLSEVYTVLHECKAARRGLGEWMKPRRAPGRMLYWGTEAWIRPEPKGVVLIIAPWNYPFQLALNPLIAALAAGNAVALKPSELTPRCSALLEEMLKEVFPPDLVTVIQGGAEASQELLKLPFDHVFFTGSPRVGRLVMEAAAKNLAPVTLELGGKSPALIDVGADLKQAARAILWGKGLNGGQTCVAPDYVLIHESIRDEWLKAARRTLTELYSGTDGAQMAGIITPAHRQRLLKLREGAEVLAETAPPAGERHVPLTLIAPPDDKAPVMLEEIFGPLLPVMTYRDLDEAVRFINARTKPLALYLFTRRRGTEERIVAECPAGAVSVNETLIHFSHDSLPIGGVGESGMGAYHGEHGFRALSHEKSVLIRRHSGWVTRLVYPPYTEFSLKLIRWMIRFGL